MKTRFCVLLLVGALGVRHDALAQSSVVDLTKIDRTIKKEPAYQSKTPKYCLLVFGPEVKTRVWLVQDGDKLHVDRNCNGDLTEEGECVSSKKDDFATNEEGTFHFEVGDINDGKLVHKDLLIGIIGLDHIVYSDLDVKKRLAADSKFRGIILSVAVEIPGKRGNEIGGRIAQFVNYGDERGFLEFGDSPRTAPVIHFAGPMQITLYGKHRCTPGREADIYLGVGTPGQGAGATAYFSYEELIPPSVYPIVEFAFPSQSANKSPVKELYEIKDRC